jgi:hypothetical protein
VLGNGGHARGEVRGKSAVCILPETEILSLKLENQIEPPDNVQDKPLHFVCPISAENAQRKRPSK